MNILLIANKGKLQFAVEKQLKNSNNVILYLVNKKLGLYDLHEGFRKRVLLNKFDLIIYISGETRDENNMMLLNYLLPKIILLLCQSKYIPFIYLSSLSVFGIPGLKKITEKSERNSIDLYSATKNLFDKFAMKNCINSSIVSILPGSIINFKSKNDITSKVVKLSKSFPLRIFLKRIHPRGNLACIDINDLAKAISFEANIIETKNKEITFSSKICTVNLSISEILEIILIKKRSFLIPNFGFLKSSFFSSISKNIYLKKLILCFNDLEYVSAYKLNPKSYLKKIEY